MKIRVSTDVAPKGKSKTYGFVDDAGTRLHVCVSFEGEEELPALE